jgi:hypothetical protein
MSDMCYNPIRDIPLVVDESEWDLIFSQQWTLSSGYSGI